MSRLALVLLAVAAIASLAGCDSVGDDVDPYDGVLIVQLVDGALWIETEDPISCRPNPLAVESTTRAAEIRVRVIGTSAFSGDCDGLPRPARWSLNLFTDASLRVVIRHRGQTDEYEARGSNDGLVLDAVRTSVTRPGPR